MYLKANLPLQDPENQIIVSDSAAENIHHFDPQTEVKDQKKTQVERKE